jgi:outer membrane protein OmpA-like peptidoglycan-associated protein
MARALVLVLLTGLTGTVACAGHEPPAAAVGEATTTGAPASGARVQLSPPVRAACNLPETVEEAPRFDFDGAQLRPRGQEIIDAVGVCLTSGALAGKHICITGYTDPRGSARYNYDLGLARAWAAANRLHVLGVADDQVQVATRGDSEARGTDEASWALDRRVEIDLADGKECKSSPR